MSVPPGWSYSIGYLGWAGPSHWHATHQRADANIQLPALRLDQQPPVVFSSARLSDFSVEPPKGFAVDTAKVAVSRGKSAVGYLMGYGSFLKKKQNAIFMF